MLQYKLQGCEPSSTKLLISQSFTNNRDASNNSTNTYTYDGFKRISTAVEDNTFATFTKGYTYDQFGRIATEASTALNKANSKTGTKTMRNNYQNGSLIRITDVANNTNVWEVATINARGQVTQANLGNLQKQTNIYDSFGLPKETKIDRLGTNPTELMKLGYSFNAQRGNLNSRTSTLFATNEIFTYDNLDRLTDINTNGQIQSQVYDNRGRITSNNSLGNYVYADPKSYQNTAISNLTATALAYYQNNTPQQISYNAYKSPVEIYQPGKDRISFLYNAAQERSTMFYGGEQPDPMQRRYRRHYSEDGSMEITQDAQSNTTSLVFSPLFEICNLEVHIVEFAIRQQKNHNCF